MRSSASLSSGRVRSIRSPLVLATSAASAKRGLMDLATSSAVVPLGTSFVLPSGSLMWMLSAIGCFRVYHCTRPYVLRNGNVRFVTYFGNFLVDDAALP